MANERKPLLEESQETRNTKAEHGAIWIEKSLKDIYHYSSFCDIDEYIDFQAKYLKLFLSMSKRQSYFLVMKLKNYSQVDIGKIYGISAEAIRRTISKSKNKLKIKINKING